MIIDDVILNYILLFILLELFEVSWQKAQTLMGMLAKMYHYYSKSVVLFLIMHPTFYFSIGFAMLSEYNLFAMILLGIKALDLITKIQLLEQVFLKREFSEEMSVLLLTPMNRFFMYIGVIAYPILIVLSFS